MYMEAPGFRPSPRKRDFKVPWMTWQARGHMCQALPYPLSFVIKVDEDPKVAAVLPRKGIIVHMRID